MEERAHGMVLRVRPLTETSLIVQWVTREAGRIATVAKGALRPKSAFRGKLDLFYSAEISFARSQRSDLHNLREVVLRETHGALRKDFQAVAQGSYFAVLLERGTEAESPIEELYELFEEAVRTLAEQGARFEWVMAYELRFLQLQGFAPPVVKMSAPLRSTIESLVTGAMRDVPPVAEEQRAALEQFCRVAIGSAFGRILPQRAGALIRTTRSSEAR